jgi:ATP-dependent RNA helicase RhlE
MQPEDYVHRIGRTGRAHAIGDAISFVSNEDQGSLRALERFIGRGIVRKRAEGFNYSAAPEPPHKDDKPERHIDPRSRQGQRGGRPQERRHAPRGFGGGGGERSGQRDQRGR